MMVGPGPPFSSSILWILLGFFLLLPHKAISPWAPECDDIMEKGLPERCLTRGYSAGHWGSACTLSPGAAPRAGGTRCCGVTASGRGVSERLTRKTFKFQVYANAHPENNYFPQNTLRYTDQSLAQEGRSFCVVGEHWYQTQLFHWKNFKMFKPLVDRFFDIGNHIHPDDSRLMNTFVPFDTDTIFGRRKHGFKNVLTTPNLNADFKRVYCGTLQYPNQNPYPDKEYGGETNGGWPYCGHPEVKEFPGVEWKEDVNPKKHEHRPPIYDKSMDPSCRNPYKVKVTSIEVDELQMKNYLHIKVYSDVISRPPAGRKCPTGKMKYIMLEVRDQDGFPVGQFTNDIPCDSENNKEPLSCPPSLEPCKPVYGSKKNFMPCMFSHHLASEAPMIFLAGTESSANAGGDDGKGPDGGKGPGAGGGDFFTEVHAIWRFAQLPSRFITQLHFATMIIEDEKPIRYFTSRMTEWEGIYQCGHISYIYNNRKKDQFCRDDHGDIFPAKVHEWMAGWVSTQYGRVTYWRNVTKPGSHPAETGHNLYESYIEVNKYYHCGLSQFCSLNYHANATNNTDRPYGFSAQYTAINLKKESLGGWDHFRKGFIRDRDINCHRDIPDNDPYFEIVTDYGEDRQYAKLPIRKEMFLDRLYRDIEGKGELEDYMTPGRNSKKIFRKGEGGYWWGDAHHVDGCNPHKKYGKNWAYIAEGEKEGAQKVMELALKDIWNDPIAVQTYYSTDPRVTEYFGTKYTKQGDPPPRSVPPQWKDLLTRSLAEMVEQDKTRCPCPFVPTTETPELQTKAPVEVEARHLHVINMLIAWVILVPLAFFVTRYYKETFSKVFFLQEFWWYTIHFLALFTALVFMAGSFYAMHLRRKGTDYEILMTDATMLHYWFGYSLVGVFVIHLLLGAFRFWNVDLRQTQILLHWLFGWIQYFLAVATFFTAGAIPQGLMNCESVAIYVVFLLVQVIFYAVMEKQMRKVDDMLLLEPPRQYFPVPVMRIFHKDAPGSYFRVIMLLAYFLISIAFYGALHFSTGLNPEACFQKGGQLDLGSLLNF